MVIDVLDRHRGVIDQNADRQCKTAKRHDVEGLADQRQHDDGAENRQRNRYGNDDRGAPAAEKQQDHDGCQQRRDDTFNGHTLNGAADECRLVADVVDLERIGQRRLVVDHLLLDAGDDIQRRDRAGLQHLHQHRTVAIDVNDVGLRRIAVAHGGDVADIDHRAIDAADRQIAELIDLQRRVVEIDGVFEAADLLGADGRDQILRGKRIGNVLAGKAAGLQRARIEVDLDLPLLAPERIGNRCTGHGDQRRAQLVDADIGKILFGEAIPRQRNVDNRHRGGAVVQDQRRRRARRQLLQQGLRDRGDLGVGGADIDIGLKEDLDDAEAGIGIRHNMFDVVDRGGQRTFERRGDTTGHLVRRQAGILPDDADHGDTDIRENVGRRAQRGQRSDNQQQQSEHDKGIWPAQGDAH
ncbi:hypothetical protein V1281_006629 [Nitrobacteraceae bacterium AZCC 2161]